ncbi:MAG: Holliday junction branch migration DNA helicase RuvB [Candidatus Ratteibacteria bacterium]|jgi:Holliday junction DNA helicase RuvB
MEKKRIDLTAPDTLPEDTKYDIALRPISLDDFIGQDKLKRNLKIFIQAATERKDPLDHTLFSGPPGLGKTTLAHIIAAEMGVKVKATSGPAIERPGDLAGLLTNLGRSDIIFIDEIHRLNHTVEEYLYGAMEDFHIDIMTGDGPRANSIRLTLEPFTLIGATTRAGLLTAPLRSRFGINLRLDYYPSDNLAAIVRRSAGILKVEISEGASGEIARRSRGTPRIANRLLRRVRDFAQVSGAKIIQQELVVSALDSMDVDRFGLDEMDKRILEVIIHKFSGGPVGVKTLSVAVGEEVDTLEEIYEPFLVREGYLERTPKGRRATPRAYQHLNLKIPTSLSDQSKLFNNT